jgi:hypothetical protein
VKGAWQKGRGYEARVGASNVSWARKWLRELPHSGIASAGGFREKRGVKILSELAAVSLFLGMVPAFMAAEPEPAKAASNYPSPPEVLPGRGLAQHDFLYSGEWDTRKEKQTMFLIQGGKVTWTYEIPIKDANGNLSEFSDMHRCSNGDIVFAYKTGWRKIDASGKTLYDYQCPSVGTTADGKAIWAECHSAQPIGNDRVLFMQNGLPARLYLYNLTSGKMEMEHVVPTKEPVDVKSIHGQFRNVRMTKAGTYLLAHMNLGKVIEYDKDWNVIWSTSNAPSVWHATRLPNGNTLVSGNQHGFVREISPKDEIVWEVKKGDLPGITLNGIHQAMRLSNGNTVLCNWTAGVKKPDWPKIVQLIEVTPDKKVVWAIHSWQDPDLGPASCIQLLDEPGKAEEQELMR